jgi:hypothetical protein
LVVGGRVVLFFLLLLLLSLFSLSLSSLLKCRKTDTHTKGKRQTKKSADRIFLYDNCVIESPTITRILAPYVAARRVVVTPWRFSGGRDGNHLSLQNWAYNHCVAHHAA